MLGITLYFLTQSKLWARMPSVALLKGRPLQLMAKISYSAYFWHFAVLDVASRFVHIEGGVGAFFATLLCVTLATAALSTVPMIELGSRFIRDRARFAQQSRPSSDTGATRPPPTVSAACETSPQTRSGPIES